MEFCNAVRFKVKEGCEEEYLEIHKSVKCKGMPNNSSGRSKCIERF